jgi:flagellar motor switch protein FliN/FliY
MDETNENKDTSGSAQNSADSQAAVAESNTIETPENISNATGQALFPNQSMDFLNDVSINLTIEVGRTQIKIRELLNLTKDSIIDLNKGAGEPVDIYANGRLISRGNIITANGKYCVRLTSIPKTETEKA